MSFVRWWPFLLVIVGAGHASEPVVVTGRAMGTTWSVKFVQPDPALDPAEVARRVTLKLEGLEQQFSNYRADSDVTRFNRTRSIEWIAVTPEIAEVATDSLRLSESTAGAFDVTIEPLVRLWGFGADGRRSAPPSLVEISAAQQRVGWRQLQARREPPALRKARGDVAVDFSSMAKGWSADALSELLGSLRIKHHLVQVGGDVKARGTGGAATSGWVVGIERPTGGSSPLAAKIVLRDQALSTSGDARNFFAVAGKRFGHLIDPRSGRPVDGELASVSVIHPSCAQSSAWATALFVLGAGKGFQVAEAEKLAGLFLVRTGEDVALRKTAAFPP